MFVTKLAFQVHISSMPTGEKPFHKSEKTFNTSGNLKSHFAINNGKQDFECKTFAKKFSTAGNPKTHSGNYVYRHYPSNLNAKYVAKHSHLLGT